MKKVAIFYKTFSSYGGQEKVVYNFSHYLAERGYFVEVFSAKQKAPSRHPNLKVNKVFVPNLGRGFRNLYFALYSYKRAKALKDKGYTILGFGKTFYQDIFRAGGGVHRFYVRRASLKYPSKFRRELYLLKKRLSPSFWITHFIEKLTFESPDLKAVIVPTLFVKEQIEEFFNPSAELVLIRNGVDLNRFRPQRELGLSLRRELGVGESEFVFSYVSTNFALKGFYYLLHACRLLKERGRRFKLIAAGERSGYWERLVKRLGLEKEVILVGRFKGVERVYLASDFFVYPTLFDASSNAVLEAMACGVPVIPSRFSGTGELVEEGVSGFLIGRPEDPLEIAEKMERGMEADPKAMGAAAREVAEKYPLEEVFSNYEKVIATYAS